MNWTAGTFTKVGSSNADSVVDEKWYNLVINPLDPTKAFTISDSSGTVAGVNLTTGSFTKVGNSNADSVGDDYWDCLCH